MEHCKCSQIAFPKAPPPPRPYTHRHTQICKAYCSYSIGWERNPAKLGCRCPCIHHRLCQTKGRMGGWGKRAGMTSVTTLQHMLFSHSNAMFTENNSKIIHLFKTLFWQIWWHIWMQHISQDGGKKVYHLYPWGAEYLPKAPAYTLISVSRWWHFCCVT